MNTKTVKIHIVTPVTPLQEIQHYLTTKIVGACLADDREVIFTSAGDTFDVVVLEFAPGSDTGIPDNELRLDVMSMLFPLIHGGGFDFFFASKIPTLEYTNKIEIFTPTLLSQDEMAELRKIFRTIANDKLAYVHFYVDEEHPEYNAFAIRSKQHDTALSLGCLTALLTFFSIKQD